MIGAPLPRTEDPRFLRGQGRYVGDLELPRMLHAAFLRSPHAHARIVSIDVGAAARMPGVVACLTGEDLRGHTRTLRAPSRMRDYRATDFPALAVGKVRHVGEALAVVVAEDRYTAEDALELIAVEYAPLPIVGDPEVALGAGAPLVHEETGTNVLLTRVFAQGDVARAVDDAALVVRDRFRFHRHAGVAIENRACVGAFDAGDTALTVWSSTQIPGIARDALAELLGLSVSRVRVVAPDVGGGFGI
jgi:carbon-monoxide dehydrogenase large subunit